jgi:RNA polymerase sigma-70 factor (ECF subfamily)
METPPTLWHEFAAPLRSFVAKRAPREVDVDDVLQEVFLRIQEQLPKLRDADRIGPWIFQIARNVVAEGFRKRRRREASAPPSATEAIPPFTDEHERTGEAALVSCLAAMIGRLPDAYREAIELTELGGMTQVEAARVVGISTSGMKSRVQRGRARLEAIIKEFCRIEIDVRGAVVECDPLRPSGCSSNSMGMSNTNQAKTTESTNTQPAAPSACCGGPAPQSSGACCALDAEVKATGGSGCGCASKTTTTKKGCC